MYHLINTMSDHVISKHRTLRGAVRKADKVQPKESGSYLPTRIEHADGTRLTEDEAAELFWLQSER
jgi:hypothetical protein